MVTVSLAWYGVVACALATSRVSDVYVRARRWIDRVAGALFVGFGGKLAADG